MFIGAPAPRGKKPQTKKKTPRFWEERNQEENKNKTNNLLTFPSVKQLCKEGEISWISAKFINLEHVHGSHRIGYPGRGARPQIFPRVKLFQHLQHDVNAKLFPNFLEQLQANHWRHKKYLGPQPTAFLYEYWYLNLLFIFLNWHYAISKIYSQLD